MKRIARPVSQLALFAFIACGGSGGSGGSGGIASDSTDAADPGVSMLPELTVPGMAAPRADTHADTISIEGQPQVETWNLVKPPAELHIPVTTYAPPGMRVSHSADPAGATMNFTAAFGGTENPAAYMQVRMYAPGAPRLLAEDVVGGFLDVRAPGNHEFQVVQSPEWAGETYTFSYDGPDGQRIVGSVSLGLHNGRFFHVLRHYPAEYGDGLSPRLERILQHWRWEDTGRMLVN